MDAKPAKKQETHYKSRSLGTAWLFFAFLLGILLIAGLVKGIFVLRKSVFDGSHRITIAATDTDTTVYSFAPDTASISILRLKKAKFNESKALSKKLSIPIDDIVLSKKGQEITMSNLSPSAFTKTLLFHYADLQTKLTLPDIVQLWFFTRSVKGSSYREESLNLSSSSKAETDKVSSSLFQDTSLVNDNVSIEVVNASGESGVGSLIGGILSNAGMNIIAISTNPVDLPHSEIAYFGKETYTSQRLQKILGYPVITLSKKGISDIVVTIGKDGI